MHSPRLMLLIVALVIALPAGVAQAQPKGASTSGGKIVCWKDKAGKIAGCGDKVPPEYQDNALNELNKQGITVKQSEPALTLEQKKAQRAELEHKKAEDLKKEEQRRKDKALVDTFSNEKEIDLKRGRDVQLIESNIEILQTNLKNANDRHADARSRANQYVKKNAPVPAPIQDEIDRAEADKMKVEKQIAQKRKDIAALNQHFDELKKRFIELKSGTTGTSQTSDSKAAGGSTADQRPR